MRNGSLDLIIWRVLQSILKVLKMMFWTPGTTLIIIKNLVRKKKSIKAKKPLAKSSNICQNCDQVCKWWEWEMEKILISLKRCRKMETFRDKESEITRPLSPIRRDITIKNWSLKVMKVFCNTREWVKKTPWTRRDSQNLKRIDHLKINGMNSRIEDSRKSFIEIELL